ncbi:MAG: hypothetical protein ABH840_01025 [Nanoarchaeota archaeon]
MNKKGEERWLTPWMFLVWFIIGIAIVVAVAVFYSSSIDSRAYEARSMSEKITHCVLDSGEVKEEFFLDFDVYSKCGLEKEIFLDNGEFYFNVSVYNINEKKYVKSVSGGNSDFEINCFLPEILFLHAGR